MKTDSPDVVLDPAGFRRLDPVPADAELEEFYESQYYHLIRAGGRAPNIKRLMENTPEAAREREWLGATTYADIGHLIGTYAPPGRVLDVGCGTGDLVAALMDQGLASEGLEPSVEAAKMGRERGLTIHCDTFSRFCAGPDAGRFGAVVLLNVLEHVPDPRATIKGVADLLLPGGLVVVQVPNDFSALQDAALAKRGGDPWWVAVPDHINYFSTESLPAFLGSLGFETRHTQADFPMEMFILMGDDYVGRPDIGAACHAKRVSMEMAIPAAVRRRMYQALASAGMGRDVMVAATRRA